MKYRIIIQDWNKRIKVFRGTKQVLNISYDKTENIKLMFKTHSKLDNAVITIPIL